jgi:hypothetical protein
MLSDFPEGSLLLLDACCIINLFATGYFEEILHRLPCEFAASRLIARNEVLRLSAAAGAQLESQAIPPARLGGSKEIGILDLRDEEEIAWFVRFAADLDDGEASVCALAVMRGGAVASDDRKVLGLLRRITPQVPTIQTPELLWEWARLSQVPDDLIGTVLRSVRDRARFVPRRSAPHFAWWAQFLR